MAAGRLWVIATPIGNLDDLSPRAAEALRTAGLVAAEDTRHSAPLLARVGSTARMLALHEHNEREQAARIVEAVLAGETVALIADAGTPLISDPGFRVVRAVREAGGIVSPVPGPCAAIAALSAAGLPSDRFVFEGFLPAKSPRAASACRRSRAEARTLIFYESSHRIVETLDDFVAVFDGGRQAVLARELTKLFENRDRRAARRHRRRACRATRTSSAANSFCSSPERRMPMPTRNLPKAAAFSRCCARNWHRARQRSLPPRSAARRAMRCIRRIDA